MDPNHSNLYTFDAPGYGTTTNDSFALPGDSMHLGDLTSDLRNSSGYLTSTVCDPSNYLNTLHMPYNMSPPGLLHLANHHDSPTSSMDPPAKPRKRKAPTLRVTDWEPHKARIVELHITQKRPLNEVKDIMATESDFVAEIRQYRTRIGQWGKDKNVKPQEMKAIVRKRQIRKLDETDKKPLQFTVRGDPVEPEKIDRWMKRNHVAEDVLYNTNTSADTPAAVSCWTDSSAPSPASPTSAQQRSTSFDSSISQTPQPVSPTLSISSILEPASSSFMGQSPAPIIPTDPTEQISSCLVEQRYKAADEARIRARLSAIAMRCGIDHPDHWRMSKKLGIVMIFQGRYKFAEGIFRELIQTAKKIDGLGSNDILDASDLLGKTLCREGLYSSAERIHRRTSASRRDVQGLEHPDTLRSMVSLADVLHKICNYEEADRLHRQVLLLREKNLGRQHPHTLISMRCLANVLNDQGNYDEAERMHQDALDLSSRILGNEHTNTIISISSLAVVLRNQGKYKEAERIFRRVLALRERIFGKEHPSTLNSMYNLAVALEKQGNYEATERMHRQQLRLRERILGKEHPDTLASMYSLAVVLGKQKNYDEAEQIHRQELKLSERILGKEHVDTLASMNSLAIVLERQHKYDEAERLYQQAYTGHRQILGDTHPETKICLTNCSTILEKKRTPTATDVARSLVEDRTVHWGKQRTQDNIMQQPSSTMQKTAASPRHSSNLHSDYLRPDSPHFGMSDLISQYSGSPGATSISEPPTLFWPFKGFR